MSARVNRAKTFKSEKLAFYNWAFKWASNNNVTADEVLVDTPQIAAVLQAMGFKLETVDQPPNNEQLINDTFGISIEVKCSKSGIRAVLSKQLKTCICPSSETASQSQFWAVSGKGPSTSQENMNRVEETHSTLLPSLSKDKTMLIGDILTKVFTFISETDLNQNEKLVTNVKDTLKIRSLSDLTRPLLVRQDSWEVDPKISPPTGTSSPLPNLTKSLSHSQPSLIIDKEHLLAEILQTVKDNVEKAIVLLPRTNNTFTKKKVKRVSNIKVSPTIESPVRSTTGKSAPNFPKRETPKKKFQEDNTPKSSITDKRYFGATSKIGSFRKKSDLLKPSTFKSNLTKAGSMSNLERKPVAHSPGLKSLKAKSGIPSPGFQSASSRTGMIAQYKKSK